MSLNDKAAAALKRELVRAFPERGPDDAGHDRLAEALTKPDRRVSVCTSAATPRKHVNTTCENLQFRVVLGNGFEDRTVEATWYDGAEGIRASVGIDVATLRAMLSEAEAYKPGATLGGTCAAIAKAEGGAK